MLQKSLILLFLSVLSVGSLSFAQNKGILLHFNNPEAENKKVIISGFYGQDLYTIDTFHVRRNEITLLVEKYNLYNGFYRIQIDTFLYDFISDKYDTLYFEFDYNDIRETFKINNHHDNALLLKMKKQLHEINTAINHFSTVNSGDSVIRNYSLNALNEMYSTKNNLIGEYQKRFQSSTFKILADFVKYPMDSVGKPSSSIFLTNLHLDDSSAIRNNLISQKIIDYFAFYKSPDTESFKSGADEILSSCGNNAFTRQYCLYYMLRLFNSVGPDEIFKYLIEKYYLTESCYDEKHQLNPEVNKSIDQLIRLLPGNQIPDLTGFTLKNKNYKFYDDHSVKGNTLIIFWSPECHYCEELLGQLQKSKKDLKKRETETLLFCITDEESKWKEKSGKMKFKNISDLKGWNSETIAEFSVNKTPLLILVDAEMKILKYDVQLREILK